MGIHPLSLPQKLGLKKTVNGQQEFPKQRIREEWNVAEGGEGNTVLRVKLHRLSSVNPLPFPPFAPSHYCEHVKEEVAHTNDSRARADGPRWNSRWRSFSAELPLLFLLCSLSATLLQMKELFEWRKKSFRALNLFPFVLNTNAFLKKKKTMESKKLFYLSFKFKFL